MTLDYINLDLALSTICKARCGEHHTAYDCGSVCEIVEALNALPVEALQIRLAEWQNSVTQEFDAETFRMNYKQREDHRAELDFTWAKHDAALEPLVDPALWQPYKERYRNFGGTGAWCD